MKLKQVIPIIAAIILIGIAISVLTGPSTPEIEDDNQETSDTGGETTDSGDETPDSGGETTDVTETETDEDGCIEILPGISRDYEIIRVEGSVNETIELSAGSIFGVTANQYSWTQRFAEMTTLQYMSNHPITIMDADNETAAVNVTYPGVYRIELEADDTIYELELMVTMEGKPLQTGINFIDLFGETGGPEFNLYPDDPVCFQKALDHALAGPVRVDADWIGLVSGGFYAQVDPPVMQDDDDFLALSDEYFYGAFVDAAHEHGLKVMVTLQDGPDVMFTPEQHDELAEAQQTYEWWDRWFDEWEKFLVRRCGIAERLGVDAVVLKLFAETSFNPDIYPEYADRWIEIIHSARADTSNPTMEELIAINEAMYEGIECFWGNTSRIIMVITFESTDAQFSTEDPALRTPIDFNEQVLYYEAFYSTIGKQPWVAGVFTERWDYWDEYRRFGEAYNIQYFDMTNGASPRNKPAEDVVALWNDIYHSP